MLKNQKTLNLTDEEIPELNLTNEEIPDSQRSLLINGSKFIPWTLYMDIIASTESCVLELERKKTVKEETIWQNVSTISRIDLNLKLKN